MKNLLFAVSATIALVMASQTALANILDLTAGGDGYLNNGYFITTDQQSTGTGVIQSFVRVQANTTEDGYNASRADGVDVMPDVNQSASFTRDLQLGAIPIVTDPGNATGDYYEFLLDINQNGSNPLLSLDKVQIYTRSTSIADASTLANLTGSATLRWNMDVPGNNGVNLDYNLNSGSGSGDMFLYVPAK